VASLKLDDKGSSLLWLLDQLRIQNWAKHAHVLVAQGIVVSSFHLMLGLRSGSI
jgi:hypothetical protein